MSGPAGEEDDDATLAPWANATLIGHQAAEATLLSAIESGRPAHAWLFAGPRGIGKATLAYRFARYLLAGGRAASGPDLFGSEVARSLAVPEESQTFRKVASRTHANLRVLKREIDAKSKRLRGEIVVADVRELGAFLSLTPADGGYRVVIIDCADDMNRNAANALLKSLEEPPENVFLILVSHAPGRLLPTLRSRCRRLDLKPLSDEDVTRVLALVDPDIDPDKLPGIVRLAAGSPGRAIEIAAADGGAIYADLVRIVGGEGTAARGFDIPAAHALADRMARRTETDTFGLFFDLAQLWLARLVRRGASGAAAAEVIPGENAAIDQALRRRGLEHWSEVWEKIDRLAARAEGLDLDRRQAVLGALLALDPGYGEAS